MERQDTENKWTLCFLDNVINQWRYIELKNVWIEKADRRGNETWVRIYADKDEVFKNDCELQFDNLFLKKNGQKVRLFPTTWENRSMLRLDVEKIY